MLTSLFTGWDLLPSFTSRKCKGAIMAPMLRMSAYFSSSAVRAEPGSPVRGPSPGREPAVTEGSGICPGIIAGGAAVQPGAGRRRVRQALSDRKGAVRGLGLHVLPGPHPLFHSCPPEPLPSSLPLLLFPLCSFTFLLGSDHPRRGRSWPTRGCALSSSY